MFEALRKMIFPIIAVTLFFFVAMIVLQWGLDLSRRDSGSGANVAAVINGEEIGWTTFQNIYRNLYQSEQQ
ncbi:MAG: SurA N-terminal domain-containing protein, partial [candidate division Zixibacteria bacterium]